MRRERLPKQHRLSKRCLDALAQTQKFKGTTVKPPEYAMGWVEFEMAAGGIRRVLRLQYRELCTVISG